MKRELSALVVAASVLGVVGCADQPSYSEWVLQKQIECKESGGELHIVKDRSMLNGKSALCILPGTKLEVNDA
ncbi:hypothetical protein ACTXIU_17160 [Glutamicibacter arilaitensis]|uniref:hypothetical protein n=1 Tax=Glutamicibacter arilaitensis TaxID=256701 RepID=UPI003F93956A